MEVNYNYIVMGLVSFAVWFIKAQMDRRYKEQEKINNQVSVNTQAILENKIRDEASIEAFNTYKETISSDFDNMEKTLNKIWDSIERLNGTVTSLKVEIGKIKK